MITKIHNMRHYRVEVPSMADYANFYESTHRYLKFSDLDRVLRNDTISRATKDKLEAISYTGYDGKYYTELLRGNITVEKVVSYIRYYADNYAAKISENANMLIDDMREHLCMLKGLSHIKLYM